jgi:hypothetical protein
VDGEWGARKDWARQSIANRKHCLVLLPGRTAPTNGEAVTAVADFLQIGLYQHQELAAADCCRHFTSWSSTIRIYTTVKGRREHTSSWKEIQVQWSQSSRPWRGVDDISRAWVQSKTEPMGSHGTKGWLAIGQKVSALYTYSKVIWSIFVSIWFSEGNSVIIWQDETHTVLKHITNRVRKHKLFRGVLNFPRRDVTKLYRLLLLQWVINSWCGNYVGRGRIRSNDMVKSRLIFVVLEKRERNSPFWGSILLISQ